MYEDDYASASLELPSGLLDAVVRRRSLCNTVRPNSSQAADLHGSVGGLAPLGKAVGGL